MRIHTTRTRDAALAHLGRLNRWLIAVSVVVTGVLAEVAANAFPGKTVKSAPAGGARHSSRSQRSDESSGPPLAPPSEAPSAEQAAPSQESAPQEAAPSQEATPSQETPSREAAPSQEAAPAQESAPPAGEAAPEAPVVSGGS